MSEDIDEVALGSLLADGVDPATALAGSTLDREPPPPETNLPRMLGLLAATIAAAIIFWLFQR